MTTLAKRLERAMRSVGMDPRKDQSELARLVGGKCKPQTIQGILNGNQKSTKYNATLANVLHCDALWLAEGVGTPPPLRNHNSANTESHIKRQLSGMIAGSMPSSVGNIGRDDWQAPASGVDMPRQGDNFTEGPGLRERRYPEISWVQAGMWTEIAENFVATDETKTYRCHIDLGPDGYVLRVDGQSMTAPAGVFPSFPQGILLYVRPHEEAIPGKHVIVRRNGNTATFKKLTMVDGDLFLEALNPDWPNRYIPLHEEDVICGVVMHAGFDL